MIRLPYRILRLSDGRRPLTVSLGRSHLTTFANEVASGRLHSRIPTLDLLSLGALARLDRRGEAGTTCSSKGFADGLAPHNPSVAQSAREGLAMLGPDPIRKQRVAGPWHLISKRRASQIGPCTTRTGSGTPT